jgi:mono/diheme cytochrome c family protein
LGRTRRLRRAIGPLLLCVAGLAFAQADLGKTTFKDVCATCHGDKGEGKAGQGPPLKGSPFVKSASDDDMQSLIKFGRTGKDKRYPQIPQGMPSQAVSDAEMAALIPFVKVELQK